MRKRKALLAIAAKRVLENREFLEPEDVRHCVTFSLFQCYLKDTIFAASGFFQIWYMYYAGKSSAKLYCNCRIVEGHISRIGTVTKKLTKEDNEVKRCFLSSLLDRDFYNEESHNVSMRTAIKSL